MNLHKHIAEQNAQNESIEFYLKKIYELKDEQNFSLNHYNTVLRKLDKKITQLHNLNRKILGLTDNEDILKEVLQTERYMLEFDFKMQDLRHLSTIATREEFSRYSI
ncbi:hypothetical protein DPMN_028141 [Dreissena polymorpha]|uniref:Uncharacterized protein n=1 Tax=Dreissena polymorpha TaxID=45954 RepID=A0A9D4LU57_DREPO|nr:hypothetical protein DPMN_028141 [Dreissena polymorpha]